ncbi:MAG TPA: SBBP repeat-containing protein, partial [Vicinamibacteria bacterium]
MSRMAGREAAAKTTAATSLRHEALALGLTAILGLSPWIDAIAAASPGDAITPGSVTLSPSAGAGAAAPPPRTKRLVRSEIQKAYENLPLYFIPNQGQVDDAVRFYEQSRGHTALFTSKGMSLSLLSTSAVAGERPTRHVLELTALGANPAPDIVAEGLQKPRINSFVGSDPTRWKSDLPTYGALLYRDVYPGIDIRFRGGSRDLEYDVIVNPGADPSAVRLALRGIEGLSLTSEGRLRMKLKEGELFQKAPCLYQEIEGRKAVVEGRFKIHDSPRRLHKSDAESFVYGFEVGVYDRSRALIIDPALFYSSYLGGTNTDNGLAVAVRAGGTVFVTGSTLSANFDTKAGSYDLTANGNSDAFVSKFDVNQAGAASLVFSTYLGGTNFDQGTGVGINPAGEVVVTGWTAGGGFPTTAGAYNAAFSGGGSDVFVSKLNAAGSALVYSTYLGGTGLDENNGMAIDGSGFVYLTGRTTTPGGSGGLDAYAVKFNPAGGGGSDLVWYFFLGGTSDDVGNGIDVTPGGIAYVTGTTLSNNFPTTAGAFDATYNGGGDAFVTVMNAAGTAATYSTYLGGAGNDVGHSITVDGSGNLYVGGETASNPFPTTAGAFDTTANGGVDGFVAKFNPSLSGAASLVYSTYLGGSADDAVLGVVADGSLGVCLTGYTLSADFPTVSPLQAANAGSRDIFVSHLNPAGSALTFSTYVGGTGNDTGFGVDMVGQLCCVVGTTASSDYPTTAGAFRTAYTGGMTDVCLTCMSQIATAVELMGFEAVGRGGTVELTWQTGSELNNLGFHLHRSLSAEGPYERITSAVIPGLGSSPVGASYRYVDGGLT